MGFFKSTDKFTRFKAPRWKPPSFRGALKSHINLVSTQMEDLRCSQRTPFSRFSCESIANKEIMGRNQYHLPLTGNLISELHNLKIYLKIELKPRTAYFVWDYSRNFIQIIAREYPTFDTKLLRIKEW